MIKEKLNVRPDKDRLINLLDDISNGKLVVPNFQRDYIWSTQQRLELFDSIKKGFPIGSLLFWHPLEDDFGYNKKIGPFTLNLSDKKYSYIIDGYQRITSLFSALTNPYSYNSEKIDSDLLNDYTILYDLHEEEFIHLPKSSFLNKPEQIPLYVLVDTFEFLTFTRNLQEKFDSDISNRMITRAKHLATSLLDYEIAYVNIQGGSIQDAVEIFSRINSKGSDMSPMWMISALTYEDGSNGFKFSNEIDRLKSELEDYNFGDLKIETILHCIESSTGKIYFDVKTESLIKRNDFKTLSRSTSVNIKKAIQFLRNQLYVLNYSLLPYNLQLIFITEFFRIVNIPSPKQIIELKKWFWKTTYSSYFSIYSLSKQRKAFKKFQNFCEEGGDPLYQADNVPFSTVTFPNKIYYGSVRSKALALFLINEVIKSSKFEDFPEFTEFTYLSKSEKDAALAVPKFKNIIKDDSEELTMSKFLINTYIVENRENKEKYDTILKERKFILQNAEATFMDRLGIRYSFD